MSHGVLNDLLLKAEADLRRLGVARPTRVMTALPDGPLAACVLLALLRSAVCVPVNPNLRGAEFQSLIPEMGVEALVAHGVCASEARRTASALGLPVIEVDWDGKGTLRWSGPALTATPAPSEDAYPDDTALILLTSGSSARPKRVPLSHRMLALASGRMARSIGLESRDCCLNLMPMFHVGAVVDLLLAPLSSGGSVLRPETMSVPAFFDALDTGHPTWFQGVPTLLHELAVHAIRRTEAPSQCSLRLIRSVSSPLPPEWYNEIEAALGVPVIEIYGMTETAGVITSNPCPPGPRKRGSVGRPTGLEVVVRDAEGNRVEAMGRGEVLVRGAGVMGGYENPESGDHGMTEDGWLKTGDEGYFDEEGFLYLTGRIGEQINRGGEKIAPREIDEILASHPGVREAAAFAMPHPLLGQEVAAAVVAHPGVGLAAESLAAHVSRSLAHFKVPKAFYVLPELPRGPGGKLRRRLLPDLVRSVRPLDREGTAAEEAPETETEKLVAFWWESELRVAGIGRQSNFFELGGDSLAAASFTVGVEKALGAEIRPAALFDHPTVAAFAGYVDQLVVERGRGKALNQASRATLMKPELYRRLLAAMSVWPGERRDEFSLVVGQRADAAGVPVFWCGQGRPEFECIVGQFPAEHPIYGTRSLYLFEGKKREDEDALALLFAREIESLRAGREVIVGGFCAGGRIAFEAACHLRSRGVPVRMVFLHEAYVTRAIDVPVALAFCDTYLFNPRRRFHRPEVGMTKRFTGGWKMWMLPQDHTEIYASESFAGEARRLRALWEDPSVFKAEENLTEVPAAAYRARLSSRLYSRWIGAGWRGAARVTVTNLSAHPWPAGKQSGLHIGHRWLDTEGRICGDPGPSVPLPREVPPGGSVTLTLRVTAPDHACDRLLEVDMVDEGVTWFSEHRGKPRSGSLRLKVRVLDSSSLRIFGRRSNNPST